MIEVNLLPRGAAARPGRGPRRPSPAARALGAWAARAGRVVGDPYLVGAVVTTALAAGVTGWLHLSTEREAEALAERERTALADSTRWAGVLGARTRAVVERDSVERQLAVIAAIDSTRYVWAHVLDEVSRNMPPYTWLTAVQQTSPPPAPPVVTTPAPRASGASARAEGKRKARAAAAGGAADSAATDSASRPAAPVTFRIVGQTVDIQALTLFMRDLEASPFLDRIQLARSEAVLADGKEVTEFTLDGVYRHPPAGVVRTVDLVVPVAPIR